MHIIQRVRKDLEDQGYVSRGFIGVSAQPMDKELAEALGAGTSEGALVAKVYEGAPADGAGLQAGYVIVEIDGEAIADPSDLVRAVGDHHPGENVSLIYIRDGKRQTTRMKLAELPGTESERSRVQRSGKNTQREETRSPAGLDPPFTRWPQRQA